MAILSDFLKPINDKNSIKEAVLTLFLEHPINEPQSFEILLSQEFQGVFDKFEKVNRVAIQINGSVETGIQQSSPQVHENVGFRFQKLNNGKLAAAYQGINEDFRNYLSFHSLDYEDWDIFFPDFVKYTKAVSKFKQEFNVIAFSLHYIDSFLWMSESQIDFNLIFNVNSKILPSEFFECKIANYLITTIKNNKHKYYDRLEILIEDIPQKSITINHSAVHNLEEKMNLREFINDNEDFNHFMNSAHQHNKETLLSILNKEVCNLIGLRK